MLSKLFHIRIRLNISVIIRDKPGQAYSRITKLNCFLYLNILNMIWHISHLTTLLIKQTKSVSRVNSIQDSRNPTDTEARDGFEFETLPNTKTSPPSKPPPQLTSHRHSARNKGQVSHTCGLYSNLSHERSNFNI